MLARPKDGPLDVFEHDCLLHGTRLGSLMFTAQELQVDIWKARYTNIMNIREKMCSVLRTNWLIQSQTPFEKANVRDPSHWRRQ